jgi:esterase/lipase
MPSFITKHQRFTASYTAVPRTVILMCGYGGKIWQTKRLVRVLTRAGYTVEVFEFSTNVLKSGNSDDLLKLADEMVFTAEKIRKQGKKEPILIGMILGALLALNILRRSTNFHTGIGITGGDIVTVAKKFIPREVAAVS